MHVPQYSHMKRNLKTIQSNSQQPSGMPDHNLFWKKGAIAMLLRNINTSKGMTNGVRIIIRRMFNLFLDAVILTGHSEGKRVFMPRMTLIPSDTDLHFLLRRIQFPVRLAYDMIINRIKGWDLSQSSMFCPWAVVCRLF